MNLTLRDEWVHGPTRAHLVRQATVDGSLAWNQSRVEVVCGHLRPQVIDSAHPDFHGVRASALRLPPCVDCTRMLDRFAVRAQDLATDALDSAVRHFIRSDVTVHDEVSNRVAERPAAPAAVVVDDRRGPGVEVDCADDVPA